MSERSALDHTIQRVLWREGPAISFERVVAYALEEPSEYAADGQ